MNLGKGVLWATAIFLLFVTTHSYGSDLFDATMGLCAMEGKAATPKATCNLPLCPKDNDCSPPTIDPTTASMKYQEPSITWQKDCPVSTFRGPCWEVKLPFTFALKASDPEGVKRIGAHLLLETHLRKQYVKKMLATGQKDGENRYEASDGLITHVKPGGRLEVSIIQVCAEDGVGNEGCIDLPTTTAARSVFRLGR